MEILNVGPLELLVIIVLMFLLLGPKEMVLTARKIGLWVRSFVRSPMWKEIMGYSAEIRELPQKIMDDTGLKETLEEVRQSTQAASDELKTQLKEVTDAARVVEAEHLRIDTNSQPEPEESKSGEADKENKILPPQESAPAALAGAALAETDLAGAEQSAQETAVVEEQPASAKPRKPRKTQKAAEAELAGADLPPAVEEQPAPVEVPAPRKTRRPKQAAAEAAQEVSPQEVAPAALAEASAQELPAELAEAEAQPAAAKPRKPRKTKQAADAELAGAHLSPAVEEQPAPAEVPAEVFETSAPQKPRRTRKAKPVESEAEAPADGGSPEESTRGGER